MFRNVLVAASVAVALTGTLTAGGRAAWARPEVPDSCADRYGVRGYDLGLAMGASLVRRAWRQVRDCDQSERFEALVVDDVSRLTLYPNAHHYVVCRYSGLIAGVFAELAQLNLECVDQCFLDGTMIGQLTAESYCALSIALGGLDTADEFIRGPVQICGTAFERGCDSTFIDVAHSYESMGATCHPYTEGEFEAVFDQTRDLQCAYEPDEGDFVPSDDPADCVTDGPC